MREGDRFGRYTLVRRLGGGGFASVWLAKNSNGEELALKILYPHHSDERARPSSLTASDRFLREARLLMAFSHPGVVRVVEVIDGRPNGGIGFAMEYLAGRDLLQMLPTISFLRLLDVMARAADILHDIHFAGVIHRDVKLSNIFVCAESARTGRAITELVKIIDFGVAKDFVEATLLTGTGHNELVGTFDTMAPESFRRLEGEHVDITPAIDQWGLGIALFHALTGAAPFSAPNVLALIPKVLEEPTPPLRPQTRFGVPVCPPELEAIVRRCLAKNPNQRFATAREIGDGLRKVAFHHRENISLVAPAIPGKREDSFPAADSTEPDTPAIPAWDMTIRDQPVEDVEQSDFRLPEIRTEEMFATPSSSGETMLDVAPAQMFREEATGEHEPRTVSRVRETPGPRNDSALAGAASLERDEIPTKRIGVEANIQEPLLPSVERELANRTSAQKDNTAIFGEEPTPYAIERPSAIVVRAASTVPVPSRSRDDDSGSVVVGNAKIVARDPAATPWQGSVLEGQAPATPIRPDWIMPLPSIVAPEPPGPPPLRGRVEPQREIKANLPLRPPPVPPPDLPATPGLPRWLVMVFLILGATFAFWLGRRFG